MRKKVDIIYRLFTSFLAFMITLGLIAPPTVYAQTQKFPVVAVGDSLTHGVGDPTKRGGYCYLIQKPLRQVTHKSVQVDNFGISGETSDQILKRIKSQAKIRQALKKSRIVVITAGGNDVMHALRTRGLKLSQKQLQIYQNKYTSNINDIIGEIRHLNHKAPIYIYGIYNPYAIYFKKVPGMKKAINQWNQNTNRIAQDNWRVHFVDISALAQPKKLRYSKKTQETTNPLLYKKDYFHPNKQGYQLMTDKLWQKLQATKSEWRP